MKLDTTKAYDRIQWPFLYAVLRQICFPDRWIKLVSINCVENCWFSVLVNGRSAGFFKSSQGLRQGDPLSPALFILAAEFLSRGLQKKFVMTPKARYCSGGDVIVSHLAYADDCLIFTIANAEAIRKLMEFLNVYELYSGQLINKAKSYLVVGKKVHSQVIQIIKQVAGFALKSLPSIYLGAPHV